MSEAQSEQPKLLTLASAEKDSSVAVVQGDQLLASVSFCDWAQQFQQQESVGRGSALVSMAKEAMEKANLAGESLDAIALTQGPGRFTGLRVSVVSARMLCFAWNLPIVAVNSLEVSAGKLVRERSLAVGAKIWAIIDAQRRQVFAAEFTVQQGGGLEVSVPQALFERNEIVERLETGYQVTGSGAFAFAEEIEGKTGVPLPTVSIAQCDACGVAATAVERVRASDFDDLLKVAPVYFRPSAAEEVRLANESAAN